MKSVYGCLTQEFYNSFRVFLRCGSDVKIGPLHVSPAIFQFLFRGTSLPDAHEV